MPDLNEKHQNGRKLKPYAVIIEQPASKLTRFRYECEGRSAGSIPGNTSKPERKTFPTIQIRNYEGRAMVVVSCVTKDEPYKAHPHSIVGRDGCKKGVCTMEINSKDMTMIFNNLGIQCVKKRGVEEALKIRELIRVDPFRMGFDHKTDPSSIDLNSVRLCFQVFLEEPQTDKFTIALDPVVSNPIYDKKAMADLTIIKVSHCSANCNGGQEMILLCEKVIKDDIQVWFYEENGGWECRGDFAACDVHKQAAITFKTPKYHRIDIFDSVKVKMQLRRPSDGATSESIDFEILPLLEDLSRQKRKKSGHDDEIPSPKSPRLHIYIPNANDSKMNIEVKKEQQLKLPSFATFRDPILSMSPYQAESFNSPASSPFSNFQENGFLAYQSHQQPCQMNNLNFNPNITCNNAGSTTSLMDQPSTTYNPSQMMFDLDKNCLTFCTTPNLVSFSEEVSNIQVNSECPSLPEDFFNLSLETLEASELHGIPEILDISSKDLHKLVW